LNNNLENNTGGFNSKDPMLVSVLDELPLWSAPFGLKLLERILPARNKTVLDIGSGTGFPLLEIAMRFGNSSKIYGLDPWEEAMERVRIKIGIYGIVNTELLVAKAETIPLADKSVDLITSNNGLNNVESLQVVLSECSRVSKPGGKLIFTMNTDKTMIEFYTIMEEILLKHGLSDSVALMKKHIYSKRKPVEELVTELEAVGFEGVKTEFDEFRYRFAGVSAFFNHFFIRLAFLEAWKEILPADIQEGLFTEIRHKIDSISSRQGFFQLTVPHCLIEALRK
jgi:arsenite methyltransferase